MDGGSWLSTGGGCLYGVGSGDCGQRKWAEAAGRAVGAMQGWVRAMKGEISE